MKIVTIKGFALNEGELEALTIIRTAGEPVPTLHGQYEVIKLDDEDLLLLTLKFPDLRELIRVSDE